MVDFLFALVELFQVSIAVPKLFSENVYSPAVFDLFALKFYLDRIVPHQPFLSFLGIRKL